MAEVILNRLYGVSDASSIRAMGSLAVQGSVVVGAPNSGGLLTIQRIDSGTVTLATGATTANVGTTIIPAGSLVFGVTLRVMTAITSASGTTFTIGDGSDADRWGATIAYAAGTTTTPTVFTGTQPAFFASATNVVLTASGNFTAGAVAVSVFLASMTAPPKL